MTDLQALTLKLETLATLNRALLTLPITDHLGTTITIHGSSSSEVALKEVTLRLPSSKALRALLTELRDGVQSQVAAKLVTQEQS